jgi:LysM repeat protein
VADNILGISTASNFGIAAYETVINLCVELVEGTAVAVNDFIHDVADALGWIPFVGGVIKDLLNKLASIVTDLLDDVMKLIEQAQAPVLFWQFASTWGPGGIAGQAGQVASNISAQNVKFSSEWQGLAGPAFATAVSMQEPAVSQVQSWSNTISSACHTIAQYGFIYYSAVAASLAGLTYYLALSGGGFDVPVAAAAVAEAIKVGLAIAAATVALELGVSSQANNLREAAEPSGAFPGGMWPQAVADITSTSPKTQPPGTQPPGTQPPGTQPPGTQPPGTQPPGTQPPGTQPPGTQPPGTQPPGTQPPGTQPPGTQPPGTQPPNPQPPGTQPPGTQPPGTQPPGTQPPGTPPPPAHHPGRPGSPTPPGHHPGPPGHHPAPGRVGGGTYRVVPGDNLYDISGREYGDPNLWPVIWAANSRKDPNPNLIFPGQVLQIPAVPKFPAGSTALIVPPGETLSQIANGDQQQMAAIAELNNITNPDRLDPGRALIIPPAAAS